MLKCTVTREIDLDIATDADIRGSVRRVAEAHGSGITKTELKEIEQTIGFSHHEGSMLLEDALNTVVHPALQFVHDWMHCLLVHGVFNIVVQLLLTRCKEVGSNIGSILDEYMQLWTWPAKFHSASIGKTFSQKNLDASAASGF